MPNFLARFDCSQHVGRVSLVEKCQNYITRPAIASSWREKIFSEIHNRYPIAVRADESVVSAMAARACARHGSAPELCSDVLRVGLHSPRCQGNQLPPARRDVTCSNQLRRSHLSALSSVPALSLWLSAISRLSPAGCCLCSNIAAWGSFHARSNAPFHASHPRNAPTPLITAQALRKSARIRLNAI